MGRPRAAYDEVAARSLLARDRTDAAAADELGVSRWAIRWLRRTGLYGKRRPGRPRRADPLTIPARSRVRATW